ncbi:SMP-30/gluconolactonase/LRE family protein [Actinophytocola xanthii]|uniref:Superoxide dismutase n=1 Tax=Actinophytocola xanthii TaxID=1912961 RepID=A0A1Q8CWM8_9PSEU|nr:superoxide dismutase [Actinophytocola xanthii]OLF18750.1 superoxide dismutase [Actinophytocola xanthii]
MLRRVGLSLLVAALALFGLAPAASAGSLFPATIPLPNGFQPEGIAIGPGPVAYLGSLADGSIYKVDLVTGRGRIVSTGPGTPSVGMKTDARGRLFVAGGAAGNARVVDTRSGRVLASYQLASGTAFVNDVVLTPTAAWFTDSLNPVLYRLPLSGGRLPARAEVVPLTGDLVYQQGFNANGIARTPDGRDLLVVQSNTGSLFRVERNGVTHRVAVPITLTNGDGLLLRGRTLYVVQNRLNTVTALRVRGDSTTVVDQITDPRFDVPTTVGYFAGRLYLPNARFGTPPGPTTEYQVVAVRP